MFSTLKVISRSVKLKINLPILTKDFNALKGVSSRTKLPYLLLYNSASFHPKGF